MLKNLVFKQKGEHNRALPDYYVKREAEAQHSDILTNPLVKVVLGPRRSGKSVFCSAVLQGKNYAYFNFDDDRLDLNNFNSDELMRGLEAAYQGFEYIFFDEIQNLPKWELFVNRLHREGYNLIVTGSNANLLGKELATALTGRHLPIEILPFSFREYLQAKGVTNFDDNSAVLDVLDSYLHKGSYPEIVTKSLSAGEYLSVLFDATLFKDVIKRHKIRYPSQIEDLGSYAVDNIGHLFSYPGLAKF